MLLPCPLKDREYESGCAHGHSIGPKKHLDDGGDDAGLLGLVQSSDQGWVGLRCCEWKQSNLLTVLSFWHGVDVDVDVAPLRQAREAVNLNDY